MREVHGEDAITGLQHAKVNGHICLTTAMRLHIYMLGAEELSCAIDCELLGFVHMLASAIPTAAGIPFRVFICKHGALRLHDSRAGKIFRSDQLDAFFLAALFCIDHVGDLGICRAQGSHAIIGSAEMIELLYPALVTPAFERSGEESIHNLQSLRLFEHTRSETQHVCVVMLASHPSLLSGADISCSDTGEPVGCDAHADTAFA